MQYDPIKRSLGSVFNKTPLMRVVFYRLLDILLLRAWYIKRELDAWSKTAPKDSNILDAGAGFGQYVYHISTLRKTYKVTGVDVKEEQIADCNAFFGKLGTSHRVSFEYADLTTFNNPNSYNLILSVDVMEHIEDDLSVFKNMYASLKEGGMLLISTPSDQGGSDVHEEHEDGFVDEHVRDGYNSDEIKKKLGEAGFKTIETSYSYGRPGNLAWKLTMKYPILMLNKSKFFFIVLPFYYALIFPFSFMLNSKDLNDIHKTGTGLIVKAWK